MKKLLPLLLALLLLTGCKGQESYEIVATTAPVYQFTQAVCAGTGLEIGLIVSDSVSCLHDYTLSVRQMVAIEKAKVVVLSGIHLEDFMSDALQDKELRIECSDGISLLPGEEDEWDPHIWLDPGNAAIMTRNIASGLSSLYPELETQFQKNAADYCARLDQLKTDCQESLQDLSCRQLITFHDGFAYFAEAFDLEILAAIEEESGSEASAKDLQEMVALVEEHQLPAVFVEKNGSRSAASVLSQETGCGIGVLDTIMSGTDYFEAITGNVEAVKEAMQ